MAGQILGSIGEDLKFKIWQEDRSEGPLSGRMFRNVFSQSCVRNVVYASLDFINLRYETFVALATRDGMISLLEPSTPEKLDDWAEIDQFWVCGGPVPRGVETSFKVAFRHAERSNHIASLSDPDVEALSLAVTAMDVVKIYRLAQSSEGGSSRYRFQPPMAILSGSGCLVRDLAWSSETPVRPECIATAAEDGFVRVYELIGQNAGGNDRPHFPPKCPSTDQVPSDSKTQKYAPSGIGAGLAGSARIDLSTNVVIAAHEWKLIETLKDEGVWRIEWVRYG